LHTLPDTRNRSTLALFDRAEWTLEQISDQTKEWHHQMASAFLVPAAARDDLEEFENR
jgi:hypothetical protein